MKKRVIQKILAFAFTLCLMASMAAVGTAEEIGVGDFQAMRPIMDMVSSAAICASDFPTVVSDEESVLDSTFITFFFTNGLKAGSLPNITDATLADTAQQEQLLRSIFTAQLPELETITPPETTDDYIGFLPVYVEAAEDNSYYLVGELYRGTMDIEKMSTADYANLNWENEPAIFTLTKDETALGGYKVEGFAVGSVLLMEQQLQDYTNSILVEYINTKLGFSLQYPSLFEESDFTEDANGASAAIPDGSASFSVSRADNTTGTSLNEYATMMSEAQEGARLNIYDKLQYATVAYETADGNTVFSVYTVTDKYIYEAKLVYQTSQTIVYGMYIMYLENSFIVDEVSVG